MGARRPTVGAAGTATVTVSNRRVTVVGSALVLTRGLFQDSSTPRALARFVDGSDVVVRMNNLKNLGAPGQGSRTDIHVVTNSGTTGRKYASERRLDAKILHGTREVWFATDPELIDERRRRNTEDDPDERRDWAPEILTFQGWRARRWSYIPATVTRQLQRQLVRPDCDPSAGTRAIAAVLRDERFAGHAVFLLGFGFSGWPGHPWEAERAWVEDHFRRGRIGRVPGATGAAWYPHALGAVLGRSVAWVLQPRAKWRLSGGRRIAAPSGSRTTSIGHTRL